MPRQFLLQGSAVIRKIQISAAARQQLQNLVINVDVSKVQHALNQLGTQIQNIFKPIQKAGSSSSGMQKLASSINGVTNAANRASTATKKVDALLFQVIRKASAFRISTIIINSFFNAINDATRFTIAFDSSLRDINKILRLNDSDLQKLGEGLINIAMRYNQSAEEVALAAKSAAQAGLFKNSATGAEKTAVTLDLAAKAAMIAQTSTLSYEESLQALLSISKQTSTSIEDATILLTKFSAVEDASAIDAKELTEVFKRAGTSISQAFGPNLNTAIGGISALLERTRASGPVIATFFKTLVSRLQGTNKEVVQAFDSLGISIEDKLTSRIKQPFELLTELSEKLKGKGGADTGRIIGQIGGIRQAELFKALLEELPKTQGGTSRSTELAAAAATGFADQIKKAEQDSAKLSARINELQQSFYGFVHSMKDKLLPTFEKVVGYATQLVKLLTADTGSGLLKSLLEVVAIAGTAGLGNQLLGGFLTKKKQTPQASAAQSAAAQAAGYSSVGLPTQKRVTLGAQQKPWKKFGNVIKDATSHLTAFSTSSMLLALATKGVAGKMEESGNQALVGMGKILDSFAGLLVLGPKIAAIVTLFSTLTDNISDTWLGGKIGHSKGNNSIDDAIAFEESELKDNFKNNVRDFLDGATKFIFGKNKKNAFARDKDLSRGNLEELYQRKKSTMFEGGVNKENVAEADRILNAFNGTIKEFSNTLAEAMNQTALTKEDLNAKATELFNTLSADDKVKEFFDIINKSPEQLAKLGVELQSLFQTAMNASGGTIEPEKQKKVLGDVAARYARNQNLRALIPQTSSYTDQNVEEDKKLAEERSKVTEATFEALTAEEGLYASRSGEGINSLRRMIELENEVNRTKERAYAIEIENIKRKQKADAERAFKQAQTKKSVADQLLEDNIAKHKTISPEFFQILTDGITEANKELEQATKDFANFANSTQNVEELAKAQRKFDEERLSNLAKQMENTAKLVEAEKRLFDSRLEQSTALAIAINDEAQARDSLKRNMNGRTSTSGVEDAKASIEFTRRANEYKLASMAIEIDNLKNIRQAALDMRKKELEQILKIAEASPDAKDPESQKGILATKKAIADIDKDRATVGEEIAKKEMERQAQVIKGNIDAINGASRVYDEEEKLKDIRLQGAMKLIDLSRALKNSTKSMFDAQKGITDAIRGKMDEAANNIKEKRGALSAAFDGLKSARAALIDAMQGGTDAFTDFNFELAKATVASRKIMGDFFGLRDEAANLSTALNSVISAAQAAGASEEKLTELRHQAASEQLEIFSRLLDEQKSKADKFFTSSGQDRQGFVQGLAAIQSIVSQFNGNIDNFRGMDQGQLNDLGRSLMSLPQDLREKISGALDQLPNGVGIAGLTQDQIKEIFQGATLGESKAVGIERLSDTMQTVADLTKNVAELNKTQLVNQQKSMVDLRANVANAKEQVLIAKNALYQAQLDAASTQKAIRDVMSTIDSQIGEYRQEFKNKADLIIASTKDPQERQEKLIQLQIELNDKITEILNGKQGDIGKAGPGFKVDTLNGGAPAAIRTGPGAEMANYIGDAINKANKELSDSMGNLRALLSGAWSDKMGENTDAMSRLSEQIATAASSKLEDTKAEININQTQTIDITGATEMVQQIMNALNTRGFVTEEELNDIRVTIGKIVEDQIRAGAARPGALFR